MKATSRDHITRISFICRRFIFIDTTCCNFFTTFELAPSCVMQVSPNLHTSGSRGACVIRSAQTNEWFSLSFRLERGGIEYGVRDG